MSEPHRDACTICALLGGSEATSETEAGGLAPSTVKPETHGLKKLKSRLQNKKKASSIVRELKTLDPPIGFSLDRAEALLRLGTPTGLAELVVSESGALDLVGASSAAFIRWTGASRTSTDKVSCETITVLAYWWGYEIALPPPALLALAQARSIQQSFFWFLQAFVAAGGAPELAPFIRYISAYLDLQWRAIMAQDKGQGVVLAATWLLPIALVPRPWDI